MMRCGCLHLPNWSVQRLHVERPELRRAPLVLYQRDGRRGKQVVAGCALAAQAGVHAGMPLAEAATCLPGPLAIVPYEPVKDVTALSRLAESCERFSPYVGWDTLTPRAAAGQNKQPPWFGASPDHLFLDLSGVAALFGGEAALADCV